MILCAALLATGALPCLADDKAKADDKPKATETLIRLTVQPMGEPKPALRYMLLPELREMNPGNPIQNYLKCFSEQQNFFFNKESCDRRDKLLVMPLKELPARDLQDYGGFALRQADWAARLDKPDWQILLKLKTDGIGLLLPDVQQMRTLASALKVRFRAEVALHHYDDAIRTAKTMFALSRHMTESPLFISDLVGIALATVAIGPLEEMMEQPGSPNLYWALTNLPSPLISIELGMQGERAWIPGEFIDLDFKAPMTEDQINRTIAHVDKLWGLELIEGNKKEDMFRTRTFVDARTKDAGLLNAARRRLIDSGQPEDRVSRFPPDQVILLDEMREYEARHDDLLKILILPPWQFEPLWKPLNERIKPKKGNAMDRSLFADLLLPAVHKVRRRQGALDQRIAMLRHVEALRLYAADHDGKLPATLDEITAVPLPVDPFTGRPFLYKVEGATAHLRGTPPPGMETEAPFNLHYEVTIQKAEIRGR
jgi:hypothetical protein